MIYFGVSLLAHPPHQTYNMESDAALNVSAAELIAPLLKHGS